MTRFSERKPNVAKRVKISLQGQTRCRHLNQATKTGLSDEINLKPEGSCRREHFAAEPKNKFEFQPNIGKAQREIATAETKLFSGN